MTNAEISAVFAELAERLAVVEAQPYRYLAYRRAAELFRTVPVSVAALATEDRLQELEGVGPAIAEKVRTLVETGTFPALDKARVAVPDGLLALTRVPGIGARTARKVWEQVGASTFDDIVHAASSGRLSTVQGLGPKTIGAILASAQAASDDASDDAMPQLLLRNQVEQVAAAVSDLLLAGEGPAREVQLAGPHLRGVELSEAVELFVRVDADVEASVAQLRSLLEAAGWGAAEETAADGPVASADQPWGHVRMAAPNDMVVELLVCPTSQAAEGLLHAIGPREHAVVVLERAAVAAGRKSKPSTVGGPRATAQSPGTSDAGVYAAAGLVRVAPELRDLPAALDAQEDLPLLVELGDLRADLHCHSTWSDGHASLLEMAEAARAQGDDFLVISDHSAPYAMVRGLDEGRLEQQSREVAEVNEALGGSFQVLRGSEVEILADGSLGLPDEVLARLDWVTASIHVSQRQAPEQLALRMERVMRNPYVDCIGHPTSRLLLRREPTALDTDLLIELAAQTGTVLEINASPRRLDLRAELARQALEAGVRLAINSDAHTTAELQVRRHGVATARRAGATRDDVVNCWAWQRLRESQKRWRA